jgi:hypothetical protein
MAKKRKGGGRRKGIKITPKGILKTVVVLGGLKSMSDNNVGDSLKFFAARPKALLDPKELAELARRVGPGAVMIVGGPKIVDLAVKVISKGVPGASRVANATLMKV